MNTAEILNHVRSFIVDQATVNTISADLSFISSIEKREDVIIYSGHGVAVTVESASANGEHRYKVSVFVQQEMAEDVMFVNMLAMLECVYGPAQDNYTAVVGAEMLTMGTCVSREHTKAAVVRTPGDYVDFLAMTLGGSTNYASGIPMPNTIAYPAIAIMATEEYDSIYLIDLPFQG